MAPIHVGGRTIFGNEATAPTGAGLGDEYYNSAEDKKYIYNGLAGEWQEVGGGVATPQTFQTVESAVSNWAFLPNVDYYSVGNQTSNSNYNGSRHRITNGTGRLEFNNYEYPSFGKFAMRSSANDTLFFQLYNFAGNATGVSNFNSGTTDGNLFQMGLSFNIIPTSPLNNSLEATSAIGAGGCNYFVTDGIGTNTMGFYNGGANNNSQPQGSTNREAQQSVTWTDAPVTLMLTGDNHPTYPRTTVLFIGNTQTYRWTNQQTAGMTNIYSYLAGGYPNGIDTKFTAALPEFRYGTSTAHVAVS